MPAFLWRTLYAPDPDEPEALPDDAISPIVAPEPRTRVLTLAELMAKMVDSHAEDAEEQLAQDVGLDVTWRAIYEAAGIAIPDHGWTVERGLAFVKAAEAKGMTPMQVALSLERALVDHGADVVHLAHEAVAKDEILDLYEQKLQQSVAELQRALSEEEAAIEGQIEELRSRLGRLRSEREGTERRLEAWQSEKRLIEQQWARMLKLLAPLLAQR